MQDPLCSDKLASTEFVLFSHRFKKIAFVERLLYVWYYLDTDPSIE